MAEKPKTRPKSPPPKPLQFGEPEKRNWFVLIFFVLFVIGCIAVSAWLLANGKPMRPLDCDTASGNGSLTRFGGCHER